MIIATMLLFLVRQLAVPMYPDQGPQYDNRLPLECSYYPNSPCLVPVKPRLEGPVESEQRKYKERQLRLKCSNHPEAAECN